MAAAIKRIKPITIEIIDKRIPVIDNILDLFLKRPISPNIIPNEISKSPVPIAGVKNNIKPTADKINDKIPKIGGLFP